MKDNNSYSCKCGATDHFRVTHTSCKLNINENLRFNSIIHQNRSNNEHKSLTNEVYINKYTFEKIL